MSEISPFVKVIKPIEEHGYIRLLHQTLYYHLYIFMTTANSFVNYRYR